MALRMQTWMHTASGLKGMRSLVYLAWPTWHSVVKDRPPTPQHFELDVTNRCNMACRHCFATPRNHAGSELTLVDIALLANSLDCLRSLSLGGGEPFLRDDLAEISGLFAERSPALSITITTNGFSAERICGIAEAILNRCPEATLRVILSLDGFKDVHDDMRQSEGAFDRTMETARQLQAMAQRSTRLGFSFNATMTGLNWRDLPGLASYVRAEFGTGLRCNLLSGTPRDASLSLPDVHDVTETLDALARQESGASAAHTRVFDAYRLSALSIGRQVVPCVAGRFYGTAAANGDVQSCALLQPLGNLRDASFRSIWNGPLAEQQRASIARGDCACHTDCYLLTSMAYHWKVPFSVYRVRIADRLSDADRNG